MAMTLQQSIKRGQKEFDEQFMCNIPEHMSMSDHQFAHDKRGRLPAEFKQFLATFARNVADDMAEAVRLEKREIESSSSGDNYYTRHLKSSVFNDIAKANSQLINNYLKGEEDETNQI